MTTLKLVLPAGVKFLLYVDDGAGVLAHIHRALTTMEQVERTRVLGQVDPSAVHVVLARHRFPEGCPPGADSHTFCTQYNVSAFESKRDFVCHYNIWHAHSVLALVSSLTGQHDYSPQVRASGGDRTTPPKKSPPSLSLHENRYRVPPSLFPSPHAPHYPHTKDPRA